VIAAALALHARHGSSPTTHSAAQPAAPTAKHGARQVRGGSITGTVHDDHAAPIAGARVCADALFAEPWCASTDAAGAYAIAGLPAATLEVTASAAGHQPGVFRPEDDRHRSRFVLGDGERRTGVDLVLAGGAVQLRAVISDVTGGPIAHALVRAATEDHDINKPGHWAAGVEADDHGVATLWVAPGQLLARASADGYAPAEVDGLAPGTVEILLTPESSVEGIVVDEAGHPIGDADVVADRVDIHEHARSDADGHFHIGHLLPERYVISARTPNGYGRTDGSVAVGLASHVEGVIVELHAAYRVTGRVVVGDKPCPDAEVTLHDAVHDRTEPMERGADGVQHADGLRPGTYSVHVACRGFHEPARYPAVVIADRDQLGLVWPVVAGATIHGIVKTASGAPVARANVTALSSSPPAYADDTSAADGSYELSGLVAGDYVLTASTDRGQTRDGAYRVALTASADTHLDLVLAEGGVIHGVVVDPDGHAVPGVEVHANGDTTTGGVMQTGPDGTFEISVAQPGAYEVVATADWQHDLHGLHVREHVDVAPGASVTVRLVVDAQRETITGDVTDSKGKPIGDAYVVAYPGNDFIGSAWRWTWAERPVLTATDGTFTITKLPPGSYTVHAYRKGGSETIAKDVAAGSTIHLRIAETGSIAGIAAFPDGTYPEILDVQLRAKATGYFRDEQFERTHGAFAIRDLPAGDLTILAKSPDGLGTSAVSLAAGEQKSGVAVALDRFVPVTGRVVDGSTGRGISGLIVFARRTNLALGTVATEDSPNMTDADGRFTVLAPPGEVDLSVIRLDPLDRSLCLPKTHRTITAPTDLGDLAAHRPPCD
jgi:hypothetical protein